MLEVLDLEDAAAEASTLSRDAENVSEEDTCVCGIGTERLHLPDNEDSFNGLCVAETVI